AAKTQGGTAVTRARFRCRTPPNIAAAGSRTSRPPSAQINTHKISTPHQQTQPQQEILQISGETQQEIQFDSGPLLTAEIVEGRHGEEEIEELLRRERINQSGGAANERTNPDEGKKLEEEEWGGVGWGAVVGLGRGGGSYVDGAAGNPVQWLAQLAMRICRDS
uniref:Uncharacterized protein n=1 Tax=Aegilops tauschii subsp. strangulata TaxID=200361 RepID=A0A453SEF8_AEGTS